MGLLSSLFAGVSGLNAQGNALSVIGNNIANMSTVGFKSSQTTFADLISSSLGGGASSIQTGIGVALVGVQGNFSQGSLTTTSNALDMAIDGNGFFTLKDSQGGTFYSRAGQFRLNASNQVVDPNGFLLQGFQANTSGVITGSIGNVSLPSTTASPKATAAITIGANLNSTSTATAFNLLDPTGTSNFSTSMSVYDSLGIGHLLTVYFTKTAANSWAYNVVANSAEITTAGYNAANINATLGIVRVASGTLGFTTAGALDTESVVRRYDDGTAAGTAGATVGQAQIDFLGATQDQLITFDYGTSVTTNAGTGLDGTTQFGSANALVNQTQDGYGAGSLQSFSVDNSGVISGRFSNGQLRTLAQVVLSRFPDPLSLLRTGKNTFAQSGNSGQAITGAPNSAGMGKIASSSLELSNVDLGQSFIDMITAQRGFQANSRIISTTDDILQELVNLKR